MLNQDKLRYYGQRLQSERNKEREMLSHIEEGLQGAGQRDALAELSVCDNHPADIGTETFERSKDVGLRDRGLVRLAKIDDALARVDEGTYGICRHCGQEIPEERLEAVPETVLCLGCQEAEDARDKGRVRPVEEQVVSMPFGGAPGESDSAGSEAPSAVSGLRPARTENGEHGHRGERRDRQGWHDGQERRGRSDGQDRRDGRDQRTPGRDGEEFWADVARYGTSSDTVRHDEEEHIREAGDSVEDIPYRRGRDGVFYQDLRGRDDEAPPGGPV